ncbi:high affinity immunoglobulin epsilon receptor subunit beta-like [Mobula birostris]|uniref:high affinity immunoglobulin epsilon receptor subunit beta-like n=1 Tax=Mobula birostris TaxID=1983395 RepID=UPI003B28A4F6
MSGGKPKTPKRKMDDPDTNFPSTTKQKFSRGQRKVLGVCQIMLGLFFIAFGIPVFQSGMSIAAKSAMPWWGGGLFIISGIMSVNAERKLTIFTLRCCAIFNLLSAVTSLTAFLLFAIDLRKWVPHVNDNQCQHQDYSALSESHFSLRIILLVFALMELSMSVAVSVIGWNKVWDCSKKCEDLPENSLDRSNTYESLVVKDTVYTSMRAIKPLEVPPLGK